MSKRNTTATTVAKSVTFPVTFKSVSDIGYQAARYVDMSATLIRALVEADIGWPNNMSDENAALLKAGILLRKHEITAPVWYRVEGKNLVKLDAAPTAAELKADTGNFLKLDVQYATGISPHELGKRKESHPAEYEVVVEVRKAASKYVSNVLGRLRAMTKALTETDRQRGATKPIKEKIEEFFKSLKRSNKLAKENRGDPTAFDDDVLDRKVAAFWKAE